MNKQVAETPYSAIDAVVALSAHGLAGRSPPPEQITRGPTARPYGVVWGYGVMGVTRRWGTEALFADMVNVIGDLEHAMRIDAVHRMRVRTPTGSFTIIKKRPRTRDR